MRIWGFKGFREDLSLNASRSCPFVVSASVLRQTLMVAAQAGHTEIMNAFTDAGVVPSSVKVACFVAMFVQVFGFGCRVIALNSVPS